MNKVAFVALAAYPLLDDEDKGGIGGAEVRAVTFAQGIKSRFSISFVVDQKPRMAEAIERL